MLKPHSKSVYTTYILLAHFMCVKDQQYYSTAVARKELVASFKAATS